MAGIITFTTIWKDSEGITAPVHYYTILFIMGLTILSKTRKDLLYVLLFFSWIMVMGFYELQNPYSINEFPPNRGIIIDHIFACGISLITVSIVTHLVTTRYITEKKKAEETASTLLEKNEIIQNKEEELNEKIELLENANREIQISMKKVETATQAKTDFLSVMSHEVRTPLNAIIGLSEWLSLDSPKPEHISNIQNLLFSSKHLLNLLNDILDYNKIEEDQLILEKKNFHLFEILKSNLASFSTIAKDKGLELLQSIDGIQGEYLIGDATRLVQILTNLIGNAIKFTHQGYIGLTVECLEQTDATALIRFQVSDTGIGIPEDQQMLIFERFTQATLKENNQYGGSGLGLAITKKLVSLYGSQISLSSEVGKGSTFQFDINFQKGSAPSPIARAHVAISPKQLSGIEILVAEDNEINALILGQFLYKWGAQFKIFENGEQIVQYIMDLSNKRPDLILMDLHMPIMDGLKASKKIRELGNVIPILALSASYLEDVEDDITDAGMNGFIPKPFDHLELLKILKSYCPEEEGTQKTL